MLVTDVSFMQVPYVLKFFISMRIFLHRMRASIQLVGFYEILWMCINPNVIQPESLSRS